MKASDLPARDTLTRLIGGAYERPHRLLVDVPVSAMSSCDGSEQLGCRPSGGATQRRFRLESRLPARWPPGDDELRVGRGIACVSIALAPVVHQSASPFVVALR